MRKKLIIITLALVILTATAITPLAVTVTQKLPDNLSAVPVEYIALRAYDGNNKLCWLNLPDQRIARMVSDENLPYTELAQIYMPSSNYAIEAEYSTLTNAKESTMRFHVLEKVHRENIFSPNSYVHLALEPIGVTPTSPQKYLEVILDGDYGTNIITYAELKYTRTVVNNTTGQIQREVFKSNLEVIKEYTTAFGYREFIRASFPLVGNSGAVYDDITLKVYYSGDISTLGISSLEQDTVSRNRDNRNAMEYIGRVSGRFDPVDIPSDWFGWIVGGVDGFMQLQILPNVTLWTVFYAVLGLLLFVIIMKKFAGG